MRIAIKFMLSALPLLAFSQDQKINWTKLSSWNEIITYAKVKHKYIFVDCFATWCGPCKIMDNNVFSDQLLADSINEDFVAVKMQMDKSDLDDSTIKSLYQDAQEISKKYKVEAYPTFLIFDTSGIIKAKETGLKTAEEMLAISSKALKKTDAFQDKYAKYDRLVMEYQSGKKNYAKFPYIINTSELLSNTILAEQMTSEYFYFLKGKPLNYLLTKDVLTFLETHIALQSKYFEIFYKQSKLVDSAIGKIGYSKHVVLQIIANEYTYPFLNRCNQDSSLKSNPPWSELKYEIKQLTNQNLATRNDFDAKLAWAKFHKDWPRFFDLFLDKLKLYGIDSATLQQDYEINEFSWYVFEFAHRGDIADQAIGLMKGVIRRSLRLGQPVSAFYDTYANLLYKYSRVNDAINFENKAISDAMMWQRKNEDERQYYLSQISDFKLILNKMKNSEPTWPTN